MKIKTRTTLHTETVSTTDGLTPHVTHQFAIVVTLDGVPVFYHSHVSDFMPDREEAEAAAHREARCEFVTRLRDVLEPPVVNMCAERADEVPF